MATKRRHNQRRTRKGGSIAAIASAIPLWGYIVGGIVAVLAGSAATRKSALSVEGDPETNV